MTYEETAIMEFLRGTPDCFVARKEIARKALKRTVFEENPQWADAPLVSLTNRRLIEQNENGHYRILKSER
ncbi:MAG TPA: hypothetical protein PLV05_05725 [Verrucomicrobiota bacterium]|jgi:hypothetical protein|nr:hypothetical protein [Verrucomicrobiota bacterium]OQC26718.1 MAG: hypothetical protein BWX68_00556 [Verrucomicrobia bacterium ADurb.Bin063]HCL92446.1 hypothetical protein [Limisphaerales bacterium]HRR64103.1 hypothetical protein [Candidatus Paceibacterota bacterium]MBP8013728.1 hypothetical protein [Verrucomicrobiota bacterium]